MDEYIYVLKNILGQEKFSELSNKVLDEINKKYIRIKVPKALDIAEFNMSVMLVIGIEKARGCNKEDLRKRINWYKLGSQTLLLQKTIEKLENDYHEYVELIIKKVNEDQKTNKLIQDTN